MATSIPRQVDAMYVRPYRLDACSYRESSGQKAYEKSRIRVPSLAPFFLFYIKHHTILDSVV